MHAESLKLKSPLSTIKSNNVFSVMTLCLIVYSYRYRKTSDKKPEMAPIHMEENPNAINMDDKESTGIAAEYTIKEDLVDGEFCVYNDNTEVDNKM